MFSYKNGHTFCGKCSTQSFEGLLRCDVCNQRMRTKPKYGGIAKRKYLVEHKRIG